MAKHPHIALALAAGVFVIGCQQDMTMPGTDVARPNVAAITLTQNEVFPLEIVAFVPCTGDFLFLTGELHDLYRVTNDGRGGFHAKVHDNPQGVSGRSLTTKAKYQGTGVTQSEFTAKVGQENTYINNFRIIGQGPSANYLVDDNLHITVNANGEVTASHDNFRVACK